MDELNYIKNENKELKDKISKKIDEQKLLKNEDLKKSREMQLKSDKTVYKINYYNLVTDFIG